MTFWSWFGVIETFVFFIIIPIKYLTIKRKKSPLENIRKEAGIVKEEPIRVHEREISGKIFCSSCGTELLDKTGPFCSKCGAPIK